MKYYSFFDPQNYDNALEEGRISPWMYCQIKGIKGYEAMELSKRCMYRELERRKQEEKEKQKQKDMELLEKKLFDTYIKQIEKEVPKAIEKAIADSLNIK